MINTLGCSNYGYWAKIAAEYNHTGTVTTELHLDSFWEIDQLAFVCHPSDSRGLGWLAVTFCVGIVLFGGMVLPTVLVSTETLLFRPFILNCRSCWLLTLAAFRMPVLTRLASLAWDSTRRHSKLS